MGTPLIYAGIGSRETPQDVLETMERYANRLARLGWKLRSGGADGADTAFERGANYAAGDVEIWLPWKHFNNRNSIFILDVPSTRIRDSAVMELAARFHPAWDRCSDAAKKLIARNGHQILGADLKQPCKMVICWTRGGKGEGGTGQALRIARAMEIPIFDLALADTHARLSEFVNTQRP